MVQIKPKKEEKKRKSRTTTAFWSSKRSSSSAAMMASDMHCAAACRIGATSPFLTQDLDLWVMTQLSRSQPEDGGAAKKGARRVRLAGKKEEEKQSPDGLAQDGPTRQLARGDMGRYGAIRMHGIPAQNGVEAAVHGARISSSTDTAVLKSNN